MQDARGRSRGHGGKAVNIFSVPGAAGAGTEVGVATPTAIGTVVTSSYFFVRRTTTDRASALLQELVLGDTFAPRATSSKPVQE